MPTSPVPHHMSLVSTLDTSVHYVHPTFVQHHTPGPACSASMRACSSRISVGGRFLPTANCCTFSPFLSLSLPLSPCRSLFSIILFYQSELHTYYFLTLPTSLCVIMSSASSTSRSANSSTSSVHAGLCWYQVRQEES